jgi:tripartite-type tricarboxylate transporter receptor subunit TctC
VLASLRAGFAAMRRMSEVQRQLNLFGYEPVVDTHEQFAADISIEIAKYAMIARNMGLKGNP